MNDDDSQANASKVHFPILINTSEENVSKNLKQLCAKGPSFVPTPQNFDWLQLQKDFDAFQSRIRARFIFREKDTNEKSNITEKDTSTHQNKSINRPPKKKTKWSSPRTTSPELEMFLSNVERALFEDTSQRRVMDNLTKGERAALKSWRKEHLFNPESNIVMRLQDKGNRFVIVDKDTDKNKAKEQIGRSSFMEIDHDPTPQHIQKVKEWAEKWYDRNEITKEWKEFIVNYDAKPGKNSTLYKTHKQGTPVRLLTSGCNTAIENLAKYLEVVCTSLTENLPSRIKNTSHLLDIIDTINGSKLLSKSTMLVSFDIINMFPSIDNVNGINAVTKALQKRLDESPSTECIVEGLKICLFNNNSVFANINLLQTNGTATGAPNSCSYADIAVSSIDEEVFKAMEGDFHEMKYFGRYRDDCFVVWEGSKNRLNDFFTFINSLSNDLKFTMEVGDKELCFLDVKLSIIGNKIETTVYSKPTNSHLYLHATSCHNKSAIKGIPKGVALRLRRICSTDAEFDIKAIEFKQHLNLRGYNKTHVNKTFKNISGKSRTEARKTVLRRKDQIPIIFSTKYNPRGPNVKKIVQQFLPILQQNPELVQLFPKNCIMVAHKRENNLTNLLLRSDPYNIKSDITNNLDYGYTKCKRKNCDSCKNFVIETNKITSFATGRTFKIRRNSSCDSKNVVYVAQCKKCGKQGVGSTVSWKPRLSNYKSHIKKEIKTCRIVRHFIEECQDNSLSNLKFIIVDSVNNFDDLSKTDVDSLLLQKERFWIGTLITQHKGLNASHDWKRKKRTEMEKDL